jgi:hypothetical protein
MIESGRREPGYRAAVRDPDGLIQGGRKDQFTERLAEKGLLRSLKQETTETVRKIGGVVAKGVHDMLDAALTH